MRRTCLAGIGALVMLAPGAKADWLQRLDSFSSPGNQLEIAMEARTQTVQVGPYTVHGAMVYHLCQPLPHGGQHCTTRPYAGPRLQLEQGQDLVIHFKNKLASSTSDATDHCMDEGSEAGLTNIHTHGLLVAPTKGGHGTPYGDYVVDCTKPAASTQTTSGTVVGTGMEYRIHIPGVPGGVASNSQHPSGLNWIHPHVHGAAKAQVSAGLAGMITIGQLSDYVCMTADSNGNCTRPFHDGDAQIRYMLLKDTQITRGKLAKGKWQPWQEYADEEPGFCDSNGELPGNKGECAFKLPDDLSDYPDQLKHLGQSGGQGKWVFTVNGIEMPHWSVAPGGGEIWRIQNASANISYDLSISAAGGELPFQVLTMDGAGLGPQSDSAGNATFNAAQTLQQHLILMPAARAELYVIYRDTAACAAAHFAMNSDGCKPIVPRADVQAELRTNGFDTGGDNWPKMALAAPRFLTRNRATASPFNLTTRAAAIRRIAAVEHSLSAAPPPMPQMLTADASVGCLNNHAYRLKPGERRRVYFGIAEGDRFMLGTSIIARNGKEYVDTPNGLSAVDYSAADGDSTRVSLEEFPMGAKLADVLCVPQPEDFSSANQPYGENWELVNVSVEVHNFHIHQSKFSVVADASDPNKPRLSAQPLDRQNLLEKILFAGGHPITATHDVIVVPRGGEGCGPGSLKAVPNATHNRHWLVSNGKGGANDCVGPITDTLSDWDKSGMITLYIPFDRKEQQGTFVFHCHILEHEDKGMMAAIAVLPPGAAH